MASGRTLPWRRVCRVFPGNFCRLSGSTAAAAAAIEAHQNAGNCLLLSHAYTSHDLHVSRWTGRWEATARASYSTEATATTTQPTVVSWPTLAQRSRQQQQDEDNGNNDRNGNGLLSTSAPPRPQPSPGAILIEHLDRDLCPLASSSTSPPSSSSLSVLVEPAMTYPHPDETHQSRHRHRQSVIRQARLEAIRQAQLRPLPDWRAILRQLVANTPRETLIGGDDDRFFFRVSSLPADASLSPSLSRLLEMPGPALSPALLAPSSSSSSSFSSSSSSSSASTWHRNGMSFAFPDGSPSVDELLHGTDGSLWAILNRTGSYLELYRRSPQTPDASANEDRPWLLTLSGMKPAIRRAAADVTRFAKDAVPVVVSPDVHLSSTRHSSVGQRPPAQSHLKAELPTSETKGLERAPLPPPSSPQLASPPSPLPPTEGHTADAELPPTHVWNLVTSAHPDNNPKRRDDPVFRPYTIYHSAYDIPRPDEWTHDSLERYVAALVNSRPAAHLAATLYSSSSAPTAGPGQASSSSNNHDCAVLSLLHGVLGDPSARRALSVSAFKRALAFACERGETHRPDARALFVRMELAGLPADTETFNIMLASQVKTQDLRNFGATLVLMRGRGQAPDLSTWLLFLRLFTSEEVKRHILHAMHACGLLDSVAAVRRVAPEMVQHDAERALAALAAEIPAATKEEKRPGPGGGDADDTFLNRFLAGETARYGSGWLTRKAAHRLLHVLGRHGRFADCHRLLDCMEQWQSSPSPVILATTTPTTASSPAAPLATTAVQPPNTHTFNTVLYHCQVQNSLRNGLAIVARMGTAAAPLSALPSSTASPPPSSLSTPSFVSVPTTAPDAATYQLLFDMAWQRRLPHVLGVIWHGACAAGLTNNRMRQRVGRVLAGRGPAHTQVLVGVFAGKDHSTEAAATATAKATAGVSTTDAESRRADARLGNQAANRFAARYTGWTMAVPLGAALREAQTWDNVWLRARAQRKARGGQAATMDKKPVRPPTNAADHHDHHDHRSVTVSWPPEAPLRIPLQRVVAQPIQQEQQQHQPPQDGKLTQEGEETGYIEIYVE